MARKSFSSNIVSILLIPLFWCGRSFGRWKSRAKPQISRCLISCTHEPARYRVPCFRPVRNARSDLPQGSGIASVSGDTDVPARSGSTGQSPPSKHVPDASYNASYAFTLAQVCVRCQRFSGAFCFPQSLGDLKEKCLQEFPVISEVFRLPCRYRPRRR